MSLSQSRGQISHSDYFCRLGIPHDDDETCHQYGGAGGGDTEGGAAGDTEGGGVAGQHTVMERSLGPTSSPWSWSACSRAVLTRVLE